MTQYFDSLMSSIFGPGNGPDAMTVALLLLMWSVIYIIANGTLHRPAHGPRMRSVNKCTLPPKMVPHDKMIAALRARREMSQDPPSSS